MSVEFISGDLFKQADVDAIGHGVNCLGAMGAGIAVVFRNRFPEMYQAYKEACQSGDLQVGGVFPYQLPNGHWVYNLASQHYPGPDARLDALASSVAQMLAHAAQNGVSSVALPRIGCGIGGLEWDDVVAVIKQLADTSPIVVRLVSQ